MKKRIIGSALLFAAGCGDSKPAPVLGPAADGGQPDQSVAIDTKSAGDSGSTTVADVKAPTDTSSTVADSGPAATDTSTTVADSGPAATDTSTTVADSGPAATDTTPVIEDAGPVDTGPIVDIAVPADTKPTPIDIAAADTNDPCFKPIPPVAKYIGTPCPKYWDAICKGAKILAICTGGTWNIATAQNTNLCMCQHTTCGPDKAQCAAIGFIGIARSGRVRDAVIRLRRHA